LFDSKLCSLLRIGGIVFLEAGDRRGRLESILREYGL
jgi:hypothetical protein